MLQSDQYNTLSKLRFDQSEQLFQLHFLIFHSLYKLQQTLLDEKIGYLEISPLNITLTPYKENESNELTFSHNTKIAQYYLNIENLKNTTKQEIDQLLLSFWKTFISPDKHLESLKVLELTAPVSYDEIKIQYKKLASKHHPDKGGTKEKAQQINQAMATLNSIYKNRNLASIK